MTQDNWADRSTGRQCRRCIFFAVKAGSIGRCRRHAPVVAEGWPVVFMTDWCGDFKLTEEEGQS